MTKKINPVQILLWVIYIALLGVLLPHTAWAFSQSEPDSSSWIAWAAAFAFEASIAALTHKLSKHIEQVPNHKSTWLRWRKRYLNAYSFGLLVTVSVSAIANLMHAVEFGQPVALFDAWGIPSKVYSIVFGAILPLVSLLFAWVLSNVAEADLEINPELEKAKGIIKELRKALRTAEQSRQTAEQETAQIKVQLGQSLGLFAETKRERILAAYQLWPEAAQRTYADVAGAVPGYVSEVLGNGRHHDE